MKTPTLLSFLFLSALCLHGHADNETIHRPSYRITADSSIRKDATQVDSMTATAIEVLSKAFPDWAVLEAIKNYNLEIVIHATPTNEANEGTASLYTANQNGSLSARLQLLAPSRHPPTARTNVGEAKDSAYFQRLIIHEISTMVFERATSRKSTGWRFHSAPSWFVQGLEQYVALREPSAKKSLQLYVDRVRRDPSIVQTDFGLQVTEPYIGGTVLLAFIEERYGWPSIQKLLESPEPTFGSATRKQLGVTLETFTTDFQQWLNPK
jgi:hypothetical protein